MTTHQVKKSEAKRQHILDSGFHLVLRKGFVGVGLQEILKTSGVPKGSFYHYFESKEAFGCELLKHYISDYQIRLNQLWTTETSACDKLMNYLQCWVKDPATEQSWAESCLIVKMAAEVADLSEDMRLIMNDGVKRLIARMADLIRIGQQEGSIQTSVVPDVLAQVIYQMYLGAALLSKLYKHKAPLFQALESTKMMLDGCNHVQQDKNQ
ncbi:TetR/AcrR family transcriptional repressor of nem operon [Acinetobacter baylyi]|uniref:TetR/AcrR family transcriptional repressor of nem operon n=1 Tax=Acinetobacter baylyi TaxID=202950 RepID=A0ABU0UZV9_ACIBI|nr:TetR/AcrR family transcriptional regulator [Acinetobacter baylyi]MDQ1210089.1 TetR/AcrR family transcriptional repressor of nem operon [Acinetobacter baylyi]MDR6106314.1 TetR/AcrR family transcriptional repressor of nem operon [Acinetobacter baylyi]MDR6186959.1 TetR/AcrR family transcriptional repressor of nem operon [Acinetobacter baylyi]